ILPATAADAQLLGPALSLPVEDEEGRADYESGRYDQDDEDTCSRSPQREGRVGAEGGPQLGKRQADEEGEGRRENGKGQGGGGGGGTAAGEGATDERRRMVRRGEDSKRLSTDTCSHSRPREGREGAEGGPQLHVWEKVQRERYREVKRDEDEGRPSTDTCSRSPQREGVEGGPQLGIGQADVGRKGEERREKGKGEGRTENGKGEGRRENGKGDGKRRWGSR
ncbi:unnamed protein product, partial [Closterium sp. NIES-53]